MFHHYAIPAVVALAIIALIATAFIRGADDHED